jgi:arylsulfatase A-like enzyme
MLLLAIVVQDQQMKLSAAENSQSRPNIVFIFSDDHSLQTIGAYDHRLSEFVRTHGGTPNIDRLASDGGLFLNSFCGNSLCSPSRASILTGLHSHAHGVMHLDTPIHDGLWTYPRSLNDAGYSTCVIGKWHLSTTKPEFKDWKIFKDQGAYQNPEFFSADGSQTRPGYATDEITDVSLDWLRQRDRSKPFFLAVHHKAPHMNFMPPARYASWLEEVEVPEPDTLFDDYVGRAFPVKNQKMTIANELAMDQDIKISERFAKDPRFEKRNQDFAARPRQGQELTRWKYQHFVKDYLRCVRAVDDSVGQILSALESEGIAEQTVVIYSSDQGFFMGEHGWFDKRFIYEEAIHMPFIIRWPGVVEPGRRFAEFIQNIDYAPTFVEIAGGHVPSGLHGRSLVPILKGQTPNDWRQSIYYHYVDRGHRVARQRGIRSQRHTLVHFYDTDEWEFFDNLEDPQQIHSLYSDLAYAADVAAAKLELDKLRTQFDDWQAPPPPPPKPKKP